MSKTFNLPKNYFYFTTTEATTSEPAKIVFVHHETKEVITLEMGIGLLPSEESGGAVTSKILMVI